jgi:hypothetical protein
MVSGARDSAVQRRPDRDRPVVRSVYGDGGALRAVAVEVPSAVLRPNVPLPRYDQPSSTVVQHARSASVSQPNLPVPQRG